MKKSPKKRIFKLPEKAEKYIYVFLMAIAFLTYGSRYQAPMIISESIAIIIFVYAALKYLQNRKKDVDTLLIKKLFLLYFVPVFAIHIYSILMMMLDVMNKNYLSTNLSAYAPVLAAIASIYLFRAKSLNYNLTAIIIAWLINFLISTIIYGPGVIPVAISQGYFNNTNPIFGTSVNCLELHDMVLALGLIMIYYFFIRDKLTKKNLPILIAIILIIVLGIKRIMIPGIMLACIFIIFTYKKTAQQQTKYSIIVNCLIVIGAFTFLAMIFNGWFNEIADKINLMGRNYYYDVIKDYGSFSPLFLGTGRNSVAVILASNHPYLHVGGVHSDILKMFIENGFIMFTLWLLYYLFFLPKNLRDICGSKTMLLYCALMVYTFTLYLTDNTENYFIYQIILITIPACYYFSYESKKSTKNIKISAKKTGHNEK